MEASSCMTEARSASRASARCRCGYWFRGGAERLLRRVQVGPKHLGLAEIGVRGGMTLRRVIVDHHADHASHRPRYVELAVAQEGHLCEAKPARRRGPELRLHIAGRGEDAADHVC